MTGTWRRALGADDLAALLCDPDRDGDPDAVHVVARLRGPLLARLAASAGRAPRRLDAFSVERDGAGFSTPFEWSARVARRPLGAAAVRRLGTAGSTTPLDAAREEVDRLCDRAHRGLARRGALSTWLADAPLEVRALCALEASTWACRLLHLCDPASATGVTWCPPDAYVDVPATKVSLVGRRDASGAGGLLRVRDGAPGPRVADGLAVDGLLAALAAPDAPRPARAVGAWPDAGTVVVVELDDDALRHAARLLVAAGAPPVERSARDLSTIAA